MNDLEMEVAAARPTKVALLEHMAALGYRVWWQRSALAGGQRADRVTVKLQNGTCINASYRV